LRWEGAFGKVTNSKWSKRNLMEGELPIVHS